MIQKSTNPEKLNMQECNMIASRVKCHKDYVRRVLLGDFNNSTRVSQKIIKGAALIVKNKKSLADKLDKELLDTE